MVGGDRKNSLKIRGGLSTPRVERLLEADSPLDPGPGLGDTLSLGLFEGKARTILNNNSRIVTAITVP